MFILVAALHNVEEHDFGEREKRCVQPTELPGGIITVRSTNRSLTSHINEGLRRSETFARLATTIAKYGVLVYIEWRPVIKGGLTGVLLHDVFRGGDGRKYLRVFVLQGRTRSAVIATIAHELQHIVEFIEGGGDEIAAAYSVNGTSARTARTDLRVYETEGAKRVGTAVARELAACNR